MKKLIVSLSMGFLLMTPVFAFADQATDQLIQQLQSQIAALQAQIAALQGGTGLHDGDRVQVDTNFLKIRGDAGVQALILGKTLKGATGVIRCDKVLHSQCPITVGDYTWWYIDWDSGAFPSGWSAEGTSEADFLTKIGLSSSLPESVSNSNPTFTPGPLPTASTTIQPSLIYFTVALQSSSYPNTYRVSWALHNPGASPVSLTVSCASGLIINSINDVNTLIPFQCGDLDRRVAYGQGSEDLSFTNTSANSINVNINLSSNGMNTVTRIITILPFSASTQPTITVLSPNGGETPLLGSTYQVRIQESAGFISEVGFALYKGSVRLGSLAGSRMDELNFSWNVGKYLDASNIVQQAPVGDDYKIALFVPNASSFSDESDAPFSIVAAPVSSGVIQVSIDSSTPQTQLAFQGQLARFTAVRLLSPVDTTLDCFKIKVNGLADLRAFAGAAVIDDNVLVDGKFPFGSDRTAVVCGQAGTPWHPISLVANQPKTIWLVARMANDLSLYAGQVFSLGLDGMGTNPAFPSTGYSSTVGNNMTTNSSLRVVDLKINNSDGPVLQAKSGDTLTLTWTTANGFNVGSCLAQGSWYGARALSGSETVVVPSYSVTTGIGYWIDCTTNDGLIKFKDSIQVNVSPSVGSIQSETSMAFILSAIQAQLDIIAAKIEELRRR